MIPTDYVGQNLTEILAALNFGTKFHDFPANFTPPWLIDENYVPADRGNQVVVTASVTTAAVFIIVTARLYTRRIARPESWGLDDWLILFATIGTIVFTVNQILVVRRGAVGRHSYDSNYDRLKYSYTFEYACLPVYLISTTLVKFSLLAFIRRLATAAGRVYRALIWATVALFGVVCLGTFLMFTFQCRPVSATWDLDVLIFGKPSCLPSNKILTAWAVVFAAADLWLMILPLKLVIGLNLPVRARIGVMLIFGSGLVATVAAFFKIKTTWVAYNTWDPSWHFVSVLVTCQLELTFGIIAASLPALNFWIAQRFPSVYFSSDSKPTAAPRRRTSDSESAQRSLPKYAGDDWADSLTQGWDATMSRIYVHKQTTYSVEEQRAPALEHEMELRKIIRQKPSDESFNLVIQGYPHE